MSKAGEVSKLAGNGEKGFTDRQVDAVRFNLPWGVAMEVNYEIVVTDTENHAIRVVTPGSAVRTLACNGEAGFADGQDTAVCFDRPTALGNQAGSQGGRWPGHQRQDQDSCQGDHGG